MRMNLALEKIRRAVHADRNCRLVGIFLCTPIAGLATTPTTLLPASHSPNYPTNLTITKPHHRGPWAATKGEPTLGPPPPVKLERNKNRNFSTLTALVF